MLLGAVVDSTSTCTCFSQNSKVGFTFSGLGGCGQQLVMLFLAWACMHVAVALMLAFKFPCISSWVVLLLSRTAGLRLTTVHWERSECSGGTSWGNMVASQATKKVAFMVHNNG